MTKPCASKNDFAAALRPTRFQNIPAEGGVELENVPSHHAAIGPRRPNRGSLWSFRLIRRREGGGMGKRFFARAVACALVLSGLSVVPATAGPGETEAGTEAARTVDLRDPAAGISDPAASVGVLRRDCAPRQVDVNKAPAAEIADTFGLATFPTVDRIIAARPWLTASDLVSVPGVPPELEPVLAARGCATPLTLPEPAPLACTDSSQVDLQVAGAAEIARRLRLPRVTAEAIVAHRPVPQDLTQIVAPRTPGLDAPRARQLARLAACVTPVPYRYTGTDWRWVYPQAGAVVTSSLDDDFALIVPPGAVEGGAAYARVTPHYDRGLPTADVHVYSAFSGELAVRLRDVGAGAPIVLHEAATGLRASWGQGAVAEPGGTVVAALTSTSEVAATGYDLMCGEPRPYTMNVFCMGTSPRDVPLFEIIDGAGRATGARMDRYPGNQGECFRADLALISEGSLPTGLTCSASMNNPGISSTWAFENQLSSVIVDGLIESFGAVYRIYHSGGVAPEDSFATSPGSDHDGTWSGPMARWLAGQGFLVAGTAMNHVKNQGEPATAVTAFADGIRVLGVIYTVFQITGVVDAATTLLEVSVPALDLAKCGIQIVDALNGSGSTSAVVTCLTGAADFALTKAAKEVGETTETGSKLKGVAEGLKKLFFGLTVADFGSAVVSSWLTGGKFAAQTLSFQHLAPAPPAGGGGGGGSRSPGSLALDGSGNFIARTGDGEGFLVGDDGYAREIGEPNTFLCYAGRLVVIDYVPDYAIGGTRYLRLGLDAEVVPGNAEPCQVVPFRSWDFAPPPAGNTPTSVILRGKLDSDGKHPSWLINSAGRIQTILDGPTYICLAAYNPVLWEVPFTSVQSWPPGNEPASCGPRPGTRPA